MADNTQIQKSSGGSGDESDDAGVVSKSADVSAADNLLDEIDDILETNAEEFVKSYVQKGGE